NLGSGQSFHRKLLRLVAGRESTEPMTKKPRSAHAGGVVRFNCCSARSSVPRAHALRYSYEDEHARDDDQRGGQTAGSDVASRGVGGHRWLIGLRRRRMIDEPPTPRKA